MHELIPFIPGSINKALDSLLYFLPEIYLTALFILVLVTDLLFGKGSARLCKIVGCAGILLVLHKDYQQIQLLFTSGQINGHLLFNEMLLLNRTIISFKLIIDALAFVLLLYFSWDERLNLHPKGLSDLYTIAIGATLGLHLMVMAVNLLSIYLAIEMVSIASYLMVAYRSGNRVSTEAGLKYVLFGAAASAIMLYGISLLYAFSGSLNLFTGNLLPGLSQANPAAVSCALVLVLIGIGFKLSFIPVHFWVPDVYEGAPTPVTAWLSTLPKVAGFALLVNFLRPFIYYTNWHSFDFKLTLSIVGVITMIAGNFAALLQQNVKRMLAYSSIGHTGFVLMAVVVYNDTGFSAMLFYLFVYSIANIGALSLASYFHNILGSDDIDIYRGLGHKYPIASVCFVIILVSLTGLPISAGFTGKVLAFSAVYGVYQQNHELWLLLLMITGAVTTVVALFYYIKIPLNLFLRRTEHIVDIVIKSKNILILSIIVSLLVILIAIWPNLVINLL